MTRPLEFSINPAVWRQFKADADAFDRGIMRGLRRRIKRIGIEGIDAVSKVLDGDTPGGTPIFSESDREAIKGGLRTQLLFGKRTSGVRIRVSNSVLKPEHQAIMLAYNKKTFRHPVFGNPASWVNQAGRPYFGSALFAKRNEMQMEIIEAVSDGLRAMGARNP